MLVVITGEVVLGVSIVDSGDAFPCDGGCGGCPLDPDDGVEVWSECLDLDLSLATGILGL